MVDRAEANDKIKWALNSEVVDIHGVGNVDGIRLRDTVTGVERDLAVGGLFIAIGHDPRSELVLGQVDIDDEGYIKVNPNQDGASTSTNLPGVFAAGDVVDHVYRQAITAAGTGCAAALDAEHYLAAQRDAVTQLSTAGVQ
jgi:thioredoxin reductase (NADPH)